MSKEYYQNNKEKIKLTRKKYYENNKEAAKNQAKKWCQNNKSKSKIIKTKFKTKAKKLAKEYVDNKKTKCSECNNTNKKCLEFHHIKDKKYSISKMVLSAYSINLIEQEINKCVCICANCHRKKHFKNKIYGNPKGKYVKKLKSNSKCCKCFENNISCLDFHHLDQNSKILNIGLMIRDKNYTLEDIKNEIEKCIILCVNCHRQEH